MFLFSAIRTLIVRECGFEVDHITSRVVVVEQLVTALYLPTERVQWKRERTRGGKIYNWPAMHSNSKETKGFLAQKAYQLLCLCTQNQPTRSLYFLSLLMCATWYLKMSSLLPHFDDFDIQLCHRFSTFTSDIQFFASLSLSTLLIGSPVCYSPLP